MVEILNDKQAGNINEYKSFFSDLAMDAYYRGYDANKGGGIDW